MWGRYLRHGRGITDGLRGFEGRGCHLHSQGVNELHTNQDNIKVLSMTVELLTMLDLYPP